MIVILPGAMVTPEAHAHWVGLLPGPVHVLPMPGQGGPQLAAYDVTSLADHFQRLIPPHAFVIGESLGGVVALALAVRGYRAIAFDPPLVTAKQWRMHEGLGAVLNKVGDQLPDMAALMRDALGVNPDGDPLERVYYSLLTGLRRPVDIVTGEQPLWRAEGDGCVLDSSDLFVLKMFPQVRLHRVAGGGHIMLRSHPEGCLPIIMSALQRPTPWS